MINGLVSDLRNPVDDPADWQLIDFDGFNKLKVEFNSWPTDTITLKFRTIDREISIIIDNDNDRLEYKFRDCGIDGSVFDPQLHSSFFITIAIVRSQWTLRFGNSLSTYTAFSRDCSSQTHDMKNSNADTIKYFKVNGFRPNKQSASRNEDGKLYYPP